MTILDKSDTALAKANLLRIGVTSAVSYANSSGLTNPLPAAAIAFVATRLINGVQSYHASNAIPKFCPVLKKWARLPGPLNLVRIPILSDIVDISRLCGVVKNSVFKLKNGWKRGRFSPAFVHLFNTAAQIRFTIETSSLR